MFRLFPERGQPFCNDWKMSRGHLRVHPLFEPTRNMLRVFLLVFGFLSFPFSKLITTCEKLRCCRMVKNVYEP